MDSVGDQAKSDQKSSKVWQITMFFSGYPHFLLDFPYVFYAFIRLSRACPPLFLRQTATWSLLPAKAAAHCQERTQDDKVPGGSIQRGRLGGWSGGGSSIRSRSSMKASMNNPIKLEGV